MAFPTPSNPYRECRVCPVSYRKGRYMEHVLAYHSTRRVWHGAKYTRCPICNEWVEGALGNHSHG